MFSSCNTMECIPQAPLSMGFSRQEYWSGLVCPPPGELPGPGIKSMSPMSLAFAGRCFTTSATWDAHIYIYTNGILVPQLGIGPQPPELEAWNLNRNHWTTRDNIFNLTAQRFIL